MRCEVQWPQQKMVEDDTSQKSKKKSRQEDRDNRTTTVERTRKGPGDLPQETDGLQHLRKPHEP